MFQENTVFKEISNTFSNKCYEKSIKNDQFYIKPKQNHSELSDCPQRI